MANSTRPTLGGQSGCAAGEPSQARATNIEPMVNPMPMKRIGTRTSSADHGNPRYDAKRASADARSRRPSRPRVRRGQRPETRCGDRSDCSETFDSSVPVANAEGRRRRHRCGEAVRESAQQRQGPCSRPTSCRPLLLLLRGLVLRRLPPRQRVQARCSNVIPGCPRPRPRRPWRATRPDGADGTRHTPPRPNTARQDLLLDRILLIGLRPRTAQRPRQWRQRRRLSTMVYSQAR